EDAARRRDAYRLRLRRAHRRRPPNGRCEGERPDRAAALQAQERRPRRGADVEERAWTVTRLVVARGVVARAQQDPAVLLEQAEGGSRGEGSRAARACPEGAEPAVPEARRLGGSRRRHPGVGLQEGRGLLPRTRLREA